MSATSEWSTLLPDCSTNVIKSSSLQDHTYFSLIICYQLSPSLSSLITNLSAIQAAAAESAANQTGPFATPSGTTFTSQKLSEDELKDLNAT